MTGINEIVFYGRSGDGLLNAVETLAQYLIKQGLHVTVYPEYDPERRESVARIYMRISDRQVHGRGPIKEPDVVVVTDHRLLGMHMDEIGRARRYIVINAPDREYATKLSGNGKNVVYINAFKYRGRDAMAFAVMGAVLRILGIEDLGWLGTYSDLTKTAYNEAEIL